MDKRIGAQFYTIRDYCQTKEDFEESCKRVSDIGYKTVQLSGIGKFEADFVKNVLEKNNLEAICTHRPADEYENDIDALIQWHKKVGCRIAGLGSMPGLKYELEAVNAFTKKFNKIVETLKENGLTFVYHNHQTEFNRVGNTRVFDIIAENTDPDSFKFILDVYWLSYAGINPADFIREHKGRIECVHFKDMGIIGLDINMFEIGRGNLNWDDIIDACETSGVKYAFVEQDVCRRNPFESLKISYDYLKEKGFC